MFTERATTKSAQTRIVIIDDHTTFAELLTGALNREPDLLSIGYAGSVDTGVDMCRKLSPDAIIMDYHLPDGSGVTAAASILAFAPETRILMLTGDPTPGALSRAAAAGACAFLPKDGSLATLLDTLRHARTGGMTVHPALLSKTKDQSVNPGLPRPYLTPRELEILRLMAAGNDVQTNSSTLGISAHTCRGYVKSILAKLGAHSQLEAVAVATRLNLLTTYADV